LSRQRSYSQEGEDLLLLRFFDWQARGFYVDVGAHHPFRYSNTQLFYERGWRGINIDAMPGSMRPFRRARPRDVNLEIGIDAVPGLATFFLFNDPALNTFDEATAERHTDDRWRVEATCAVEVVPLAMVLDAHCPPSVEIDFMTIDVEGRDLRVLRSNDWSRFRPRVILAESLGRALDELGNDPAAHFLRDVGYAPFGKTCNTFMFIRD
jgi:FkbM family methyltransferase